MPPNGRRRNNYSSQAGIRPFTGSGRQLGRGTGRSYLSRFANLAGAAATAAIPGVVAWGTSRMKRKANQISSSRPMMNSRKSIPEGKVFNEGTGGQCSYFTKGAGKNYLPKHVEDALPPQKIVSTTPFQLKSAVGKQNILSTSALLSSGLATTFTGNGITKVLYKKGTMDITMNNIFLSNCYIMIYDVVARKDVDQAAIFKPDLAWIQGDTDQSASTAYTILGSTPFQSEAFNQFYRVEQITNIVLAAGGTHVHKVKIQPERVISSAYSKYAQYDLKDISYHCMIEIHGSPANDSTTQTQVSVGQGGLNIIVDQEETLKQLQNATPTITLFNSLPTAFTVGEQVVNLGGSTIVTQAEG